MKSSADCRDKSPRRRDIRAHAPDGVQYLNGLDYLEVDDSQTVLTLYFLGKAPRGLTENNIRIEGGVRIRNIKVVAGGIHLCEPTDPRVDDCMRVTVDRPGDFSTYTLRLVNTDVLGHSTNEPLDGFDPLYTELDFTFKASCPSDLDCAGETVCPPDAPDRTEINYLAKDYGSFRQLIFDRLALLVPDWQERHVPDLGVMLVEVLAYVGDYLSYYQDAVATEAYLGTARQRISVRRHARLVDYRLHEGCNARVWLFIETDTEHITLGVGEFFFITAYESEPTLAGRRMLSLEDLRDVPRASYEIFEAMIQPNVETIELYKAHNRIQFYTWGNRECCLPRGATTATLKDAWASTGATQQDDEEKEEPPPDQYYSPGHRADTGQPRAEDDERTAGAAMAGRKPAKYRYEPEEPEQPPPPPERVLKLKAGDVLIFEEVLGPITGEQSDADPAHRHVVRLTRVTESVDALYDQPVLEIEWAREDALPFALCISSIGRAPGCAYLEDVSIARGNVLLADHGQRITPPLAWSVSVLEEASGVCEAANKPAEPQPPSGRSPRRFTRMIYREPLPESDPNAEAQKQIVLPDIPLTHRALFPASAVLAAEQATLLSKLMAAVRERLNQIWTRVRDRGGPLTEEELAELRTIFGAQALRDAGLEPATRDYRPRASDEEEQLAALERLLAWTDRLLVRKERRLSVLIERASAGYVLGDFEEQEITEMFGPALSVNLSADNSLLLGPASLALMQDPREAVPVMTLSEQAIPFELLDQQAQAMRAAAAASVEEVADGKADEWTAQIDLLDSSGADRHFVVEIDNDGLAHLRFGDDEAGRAPLAGTILTASYRVGNGTRGNVGAEGISHIVFRGPKPGAVNLSVRNPLPSMGGTEPEPVAQARLLAPVAFRKELQRAVTSDDYAQLAQRGASALIQRAASPSLHWNGSWYEAVVAVDPLDTEEPDVALLKRIEGYLYPYRRIGHDLSVGPARYVSLDVGLLVCVKPEYLRAHVEAAILDLFSNRALPDGSYGLFHPNNLSFGQSIYVSRLVAAAQGVEGVLTCSVTRLQRLYEQPNHEIENGFLALAPLEVARLDNDPNFHEHGKLQLDMRGGR